MTETGFTLTFPGGSPVFTATGNLEITHATETQFFLEGLNQIATFFETFFDDGGQDRGDSNMQTVAVGVGAGVHTITVDFTQWEGSTQSWGSAADSDDAPKKLQVLNRAITTNRISSDNVATLEVREYESGSGGTYDEIPVVIQSSSLTFNSAEETSTFRGQLTFIEATDLSLTVDGSQQNTDR